jgi:glycerophosphoryl diester phosphodiesterase
MKTIFGVAFCLAASIIGTASQQTSTAQKQDTQASPAMCPMHDAHSQVNERGEKGMGFSQTATTHHFFLNSSGGVIQVEATDAAGASDKSSIRMHLEHIAQAFQNGDFDIPMFVHNTVPPGVPEMKRLRENIHYSFEETARGGRVVISSSDKEALDAIHRFLRFQIEEHRTGDAVDVH